MHKGDTPYFPCHLSVAYYLFAHWVFFAYKSLGNIFKDITNPLRKKV